MRDDLRAPGRLAKQVARICTGPSTEGIERVFLSLFPDLACAGMHFHFAVAYNDAATATGRTAAECVLSFPAGRHSSDSG